jgi:hypothetical protein
MSIDFKTVMSFLLFLLLLFKVYGVAGFSLTTSTALITAAPLSVLIGTIALYAYAFIAFLTLFLLWLLTLGIRGLNKDCHRFAPLIFALMILSALLTPWLYLIDVLICTVLPLSIALMIYWVVHRRRNKGERQDSPGDSPLSRLVVPQVVRTIVLTFVLLELMVFVLATLSKPWVPAQVVTLDRAIYANPVHPPKSNISKTLRPVVFITSEANGQVTMLMDENRYLVSVPEEVVTWRTTCHLNDQFSGTLPWVESMFGQRYKPHNISCWRLTDQPEEQAKKSHPLIVKILEWDFLR